MTTETNSNSIENKNKISQIIEHFESTSNHCIQCGKEVEKTYEKIFKDQYIRLVHCPHCNEIVDKYIEYDNILIFFDLLLQKQPVYRHMLFNKKDIFTFLCKVLLGTLFLQAFVHNSYEPNLLKLISRTIQLLIEDGLYCLIVTIILFCIPNITTETTNSNKSDKTMINRFKDTFTKVMKSWIMRSIGKIFFVLVLMWDGSQALYMFCIIISNMIFLSSISVLFTISQMKTMIFGMIGSLFYQLLVLSVVNPTFFHYFSQII